MNIDKIIENEKEIIEDDFKVLTRLADREDGEKIEQYLFKKIAYHKNIVKLLEELKTYRKVM